MMEVEDPGGLGLPVVKTGALQEGDRLQGEDPLLVGALHHAVGLLQGEAALLAGRRGEAMQEAGDVEAEVGDLLRDEALHLAVMDLPAMKVPQTGDAIVQQAT